MFKIWYLRFILNYPTYFHDHVTPKLGLTLQNQNCFSKRDTISNVSAKKEDLLRGRKRVLWTPLPLFSNSVCSGENKPIPSSVTERSAESDTKRLLEQILSIKVTTQVITEFKYRNEWDENSARN